MSFFSLKKRNSSKEPVKPLTYMTMTTYALSSPQNYACAMKKDRSALKNFAISYVK